MGSNRGRVSALVVVVLLLVAVVVWWRRPHETSNTISTSITDAGSIAIHTNTPASHMPAAPNSGGNEPPVAVALPPASDASAERMHVFATAPWGSALGQLGHDRPHEANPEGPMSLTSDAHGNVFVLDNVNRRLVRYDRDGHAAQAFPLSQGAPQDVAVARDGSMAVLDRHADQNVTILGPDGATRGTLPLVGTGITEAGAVTSMIVDGNDVYVEREHGPLVRIGDINGTADPTRGEIPGRPTRDGQSYITAGLIDPTAGRFYVNSIARDTGDHRWTRELHVELTLLGILLLDTDLHGTIYTAVLGTPPGAEENHGAADIVGLMCLDPTDGHPIGQIVLPPNTLPEESFREITVLDEGGVVYQLRDEHGVSLQRYNCN